MKKVIIVFACLIVSYGFGKSTGGKAICPVDYKPGKPQVISQGNDDLAVTFYARNFSQGNAVYCEITSKDATEKIAVRSFTFAGRRVPVMERDWGYRALTGLGARMRPGRKDFALSYIVMGKRKFFKSHIKVKKTHFYKYPHPIYLGKFSNMSYMRSKKVRARIARNYKLKKKAFSSRTQDQTGINTAHPRSMHYITSPFWAQRMYVTFKKKGKKRIPMKRRYRPHKGLDLRGKTGEPVYAIMDGTVVLARKLFYEGNFMLIDHGNQIFSYFMHLSKFSVKEGAKVKAGEKVAEVGSTGMSTASHLHVSLLMRGWQVDPLSILELPLR